MSALASQPAAVCPPATYRRREPEETVLYEVIREHLETFVATEDPPGHVRRALGRFLDCGVLAKGFVRVRCPKCAEENLVAVDSHWLSPASGCRPRHP